MEMRLCECEENMDFENMVNEFSATMYESLERKFLKNKHLGDFLSLKCVGDVLNVVGDLGNKKVKEITESMSVIRQLKRIAFKRKDPFQVYDLCAGNALTSVLAAFLFKNVSMAFAVDKAKRERAWDSAQRFTYINRDIYTIDPAAIEPGTVIVSVHPCKNLAEQVVKLYNESKAGDLIMMPCCNGNFAWSKYPEYVREQLGKYTLWCMYLMNKCNGTLHVDGNVLSPKNHIIVASKSWKE